MCAVKSEILISTVNLIFNQLSLDAVEKQMIYNSIPISKWNLESAGEL